MSLKDEIALHILSCFNKTACIATQQTACGAAVAILSYFWSWGVCENGSYAI